MKAITLWQPWASLMAVGAKTVETRTWATLHRGTLAIHAAAREPVWVREKWMEDRELLRIFRMWFSGPPLVAFKRLPRGAVLAECKLFHVCPTDIFVQSMLRGPGWAERLMGDYSPGRYAWLTQYMVQLPEPVPYKGRQSLWNLPAPGGRIFEAHG